MTLEEFLRLIQPNLTLIATLFGFLILFIRLFWMFLQYEDKLREENLAKVKELLLSFRKKHIETKLEKWYSDVKYQGYKWAVEALRDNLLTKEFNAGNGTMEVKLASTQDIQDVLDENALGKTLEGAQKEIEKEAQSFTMSAEGNAFYNSLDKLYQTKSKINSGYIIMKYSCRIVWWSCLFLSVMAIVGILVKLGNAPDYINYLWLYVSLSAFIVGLCSFMYLFYKRSQLTKEWEQQQLSGEGNE